MCVYPNVDYSLECLVSKFCSRFWKDCVIEALPEIRQPADTTKPVLLASLNELEGACLESRDPAGVRCVGVDNIQWLLRFRSTGNWTLDARRFPWITFGSPLRFVNKSLRIMVPNALPHISELLHQVEALAEAVKRIDQCNDL